MNELVRIDNEQIVTDSRNVAEHFGKRHDHVIRAIDNLVTQNGGTKNMFLEQTREYRGQNFRYFLMNRDGFSLLVMGFTGKKALEWKIKYIEAFNAMEAEFKKVPPLSPAEEMARGLLAAQKVIAEKDAKIAELTPKGIFADAVATSNTSILVGEMAKLLKQNGVDIGQNRLFELLREKGFLIKHGSSKNMPTQRAMEMKLFEIKESHMIDANGNSITRRTPKVTGKGQVYFINKFLYMPSKMN